MNYQRIYDQIISSLNADRNRGEGNPNFGKRGEETSNYGLKRSSETKHRLSLASKGKLKSESHKVNLRKSRAKQIMKKRTKDEILRISNTLKSNPKVMCPHCG